MTNRELVNKAFHNEPTDRIPVGFCCSISLRWISSTAVLPIPI